MSPSACDRGFTEAKVRATGARIAEAGVSASVFVLAEAYGTANSEGVFAVGRASGPLSLSIPSPSELSIPREGARAEVTLPRPAIECFASETGVPSSSHF